MRWAARLALVTLLATGCAASPDPGGDTPGSFGGTPGTTDETIAETIVDADG